MRKLFLFAIGIILFGCIAPPPVVSLTPTPQQSPSQYATLTPTPAPSQAASPTPSPTPALQSIPNGDFETGTYAHWTATGNAFGSSPARGPFDEMQGTYYASSFRPTREYGATGTLTSDAFTINRNYIEFLAIGLQTGQLHIDLIVDGQPVRSVSFSNPSEHFKRISWNVAQWKGKQAQIRIVDEYVRGYLEVDDFYLTDSPTATPS